MESASPKKTTVDVLSELRTGDAWVQIMAENMALNSAKTEGEQAQAEMEAYANASYALHDEEFVHRPVTIIGLGRTAADSTLRLMAVSGMYVAVSSMPCGEELAEQDGVLSADDEVLALCVKAGAKKQREDYYFALHPAALVHAEAEIIETDESRLVHYLKTAAWQVQSALRSKEFLSATKHDQQKQVEYMQQDLDQALEQVHCLGDMAVHCSGHAVHTQQSEMYQFSGSSPEINPLAEQLATMVNARTVPCEPRKVLNGSLRFVIPRANGRWGDAPVLEISADDTTQYWVTMEQLQDIVPNTSHDDAEATVDLLEEYLDDEWQETAQDLADDLTYGESVLADDEWQEDYLDAVRALEDRLPNDALLDGVIVTGMVIGDEGYELIDETCSIEGVDFMKIKGKYRAVLCAGAYDSESGEERRLRIIPDRHMLSRFEAIIGNESEAPDLVQELQEEALTARAIVHSPGFFDMPLDEQRDILSAPAEAVEDNLRVASNLFENCNMSFRVTSYRCLPGALLSVVPWGDSAVTEQTADEGETLLIVSDEYAVSNPDLDDTERTEPFRSLVDFPLTNGEPSVILEDKTTDLFYLVRARDIVYVAPVFHSA